MLVEISGTKTTFKLADGVYEVIVDGTTTTQKSYVDGVIMNNRVLIGSTQSANDTVYLHTDHLGSVEATTNALGQFVNRMSFGAWGERQKSDWKPGSPTETFSTTNGFTGHDQLDNHNLIHMGGRVYDPGLGRFLSADIYIQSPYNTQSYNRYSYTFNNPLSYTDPTGYHSGAFEYLMDRSYYQSSSWSWSTTVSYVNTTRWEGWRVVNPDGSRDGYMTWTDTSTANSVSASSILQTQNSYGSFSDTGFKWPTVSQTVNYGVGLGNAVSFGAGGAISEWVNGDGAFDRDSDAFRYGGYTGFLAGAAGVVKGTMVHIGSKTVTQVITPTYKQLQGINKGFQAHHILPQYLGKMLGYTQKQMMDHPAIALVTSKHVGKDSFHAAINRYLPYQKDVTYSSQQIYSGLQKAYSDIGRTDLFKSIQNLIQ